MMIDDAEAHRVVFKINIEGMKGNGRLKKDLKVLWKRG